MYCTVQDIETAISATRLAELSDDADGSVVNVTVVESIIRTNTDTINDYLRGKYILPLRNNHNIIKQTCIDMVRYELCKRRSGVLTDSERKEYESSIKTLLNLQKGIIVLDENTNTQVAGSVVSIKTRPSVMIKVREQYGRFLK